jgi:hypothetical protein
MNPMRSLRLAGLVGVMANLMACVVDDRPPPMPPRIAEHARVFTPPAAEPVVYLRGEVRVPGRYMLLGPARLSAVLDAAGGLTPGADRHVVVSRRFEDGRLVRWVVATDEARAGLAEDPWLQPEDTVDAIFAYGATTFSQSPY